MNLAGPGAASSRSLVKTFMSIGLRVISSYGNLQNIAKLLVLPVLLAIVLPYPDGAAMMACDFDKLLVNCCDRMPHACGGWRQ